MSSNRNNNTLLKRKANPFKSRIEDPPNNKRPNRLQSRIYGPDGGKRTNQRASGSPSPASPKTSSPSSSSDESMIDICQCLMYCSQHNTMVVTSMYGSQWVPVIQLSKNDSWNVAVIALIDIVLKSGRPEHLKPVPINTYRVQIVQVCTFVTRVTYIADVRHDRKTRDCYRSGEKYRWIGVNETVNGMNSFWGPEPYLWTMVYVMNKNPGHYTVVAIEDYSLELALRYLPRDRPQFKEDELLKAATIKEKDIGKLYQRFMNHCYPSQFMSYRSFKYFMRKIDWKGDKLQLSSVFRALNYTKTGYLSFHEVLLGFAAMDQSTAHGSIAAELRCGYIFRYYDLNGDGLWDEENVCEAIKDIEADRGVKQIDVNMIRKKARNAIRSVGANGVIAYKQFVTAVSTLKFRGTSALFRSNSVTAYRMAQHSVTAGNSSGAVEMVAHRQYKGVCKVCRERKYELSMHLIQMDANGRLTGLIDLKKVFPSARFIDDMVHKDSVGLANEFLHRVRQFCFYFFDAEVAKRDNITADQLRNLFYPTHQLFIDNLLALASKAAAIFAAEPRVPEVSSPAVVVGDIHGNLPDLITYDRNLWRLSPLVNAATYVFLGDYVDRGIHGIQCVAYLFAMKILAPHRFVLLRGNHEHRPLQTDFTFKKECRDNANLKVWEALNDSFDRLPVAAVIDGLVYCAHGGIPATQIELSRLQAIPCPLPDPEGQSAEAWQILWNDPIDESGFEEALALQRGDNSLAKQGYVANIKRGTACFYGEKAVQAFLSANSLSHVVRAHEMFISGYKFMMKGRVISVFSSSRYCGANNEAAVIYVDREKLRVVRIET